MPAPIPVQNFPFTAALPLAVKLVSTAGAFYDATGGGGGGGGNITTAAKGTTSAGSPTSEATDANTQSLHTKIVNASIPVTGTFFQTTQPISVADATATGTISAVDAVVAAPAGAGAVLTGASTAGSVSACATTGGVGTWTLAITGGTITGGVYYFEASLDSTNGTDGNWVAITARRQGYNYSISTATDSFNATSSNGMWQGTCAGFSWVRVRLVGGTVFVNATTRWRLSRASNAVSLTGPIPAGEARIGGVMIDQFAMGTTNGTSIVGIGLNPVFVGNGVAGTGTQRVTIASDNTAFGVNALGDVAHDAVDSALGPVKIGSRAITAGLPTAVANADRVQILMDVYGRQVSRRFDTFHINHAPAAATQATIARAAAGAGIKNVCTSITCTLSSTAAPTAGRVIFNLRDGTTGAGTILWTGALSLQATAGICATLPLTDLWIEGTANTAMTLESAAAPSANIFATVSWSGTITQ